MGNGKAHFANIFLYVTKITISVQELFLGDHTALDKLKFVSRLSNTKFYSSTDVST